MNHGESDVGLCSTFCMVYQTQLLVNSVLRHQNDDEDLKEDQRTPTRSDN